VFVGRARAEEAQFVVLGERGRGTIAKDEANRMQEKLAIAALKVIDGVDRLRMEQQIGEMQRRAKSERDSERREKELKAALRQSRTHEGEYQLRCVCVRVCVRVCVCVCHYMCVTMILRVCL